MVFKKINCEITIRFKPNLTRDRIYGKEKVNKENLANVRLYRMDATQMNFKDESFDKVLLSLVLHETDEELAKKIIKEAMRVMKPDGELVVTEWERSDNFIKKILFIPIEILEPKPYKTFVTKDHKKYFKEFGLEQVECKHCDYSKVMRLKKMEFVEDYEHA
mgnify:CR=1 FL=1